MPDPTIRETNDFMKGIMKEDATPCAPKINKMMAGNKLDEVCSGKPKHDGSGKGKGNDKDRKGLKDGKSGAGRMRKDAAAAKKALEKEGAQLEDLPNTPESIPWGKGSKGAKAKRKVIKRIPRTAQGDDEYMREEDELEEGAEEIDPTESIGTPSTVSKKPRIGTKVPKRPSAGVDTEWSEENPEGQKGRIEIKRWGVREKGGVGKTAPAPGGPSYTKNGRMNIERIHNTNL